MLLPSKINVNMFGAIFCLFILIVKYKDDFLPYTIIILNSERDLQNLAYKLHTEITIF